MTILLSRDSHIDCDKHIGRMCTSCKSSVVWLFHDMLAADCFRGFLVIGNTCNELIVNWFRCLLSFLDSVHSNPSYSDNELSNACYRDNVSQML